MRASWYSAAMQISMNFYIYPRKNPNQHFQSSSNLQRIYIIFHIYNRTMASATPCQRNLQSPSSFFQNSNPSLSSSEYTTSDSVLEDHVYVCGGCATRASKRNHRQRVWKLLVVFMSRFVIDMVLWTSFISAVFYTERLQDLGRSGRYTFNAVNVGLPLMLGLNYNAAFQTMAGIMRWKVLASGRFTFKEVCDCPLTT